MDVYRASGCQWLGMIEIEKATHVESKASVKGGRATVECSTLEGRLQVERGCVDCSKESPRAEAELKRGDRDHCRRGRRGAKSSVVRVVRHVSRVRDGNADEGESEAGT